MARRRQNARTPASSPQRKRRKRSRSQAELYDVEGFVAPSTSCAHQDANVCKPSTPTSTATKVGNKTHGIKRASSTCATVGSRLATRKKTCRGRSNTCGGAFQTIPSSATSPRGSTSNERASEPFWSSHARVGSARLWLPTEIASADSPLNWSNGCFTPTESRSWFSTQQWTTTGSPRTSSQSSMCSVVESMVKESTCTVKKTSTRLRPTKASKAPPVNRSRRLRLFPHGDALQTLKGWFGAVRSTYNWALACIKAKPDEYQLNEIWLRKRFINKQNIPKHLAYLTDTPKHVRDTAITDLVLAYKTNFQKANDDPNHRFDVSFRSKKRDGEPAITIPKASVKLILDQQRVSMYPTILKQAIDYHVRAADARRGRHQQSRELARDCKLVMERNGRIYLVIPEAVDARESQASPATWVSLDPGVRTFMTAYSPTQDNAYKFGHGDISRIQRLCTFLDRLISKRKKVKAGRRSRYGRAITSMRLRIRHLVDEMHWKVIHFLTSTFANIVIPPFEVSSMVRRATRRIHSTTVRNMLSWRHFEFRQRLLTKCRSAMTGCAVYVCGEEYTTKTCTACMHINHGVRGEKTLRCPACGLVVDRDLSGARNIFLKNVMVCPDPT